ncbi:MAG: AAA family ATPase, partial [Burkholderiales bacterium]
MAPTLHFFCGKAGAGKSTLAARIAQETGAVLISEDVWMTRL